MRELARACWTISCHIPLNSALDLIGEAKLILFQKVLFVTHPAF